MNILIANRGLPALKFILSMREFACESKVNPNCQILNQYERIIDGVLEPLMLRDQIIMNP